MPIIIFKYPNKGIHAGRMRNVSGRKMKLLPAAVRAGPVPGLGDIFSKLFTPWQTALHIYYGAVVQLPPRIMEVHPIPPPPIGKKRGTKHESKMKSKTTAKTTGLQMIFDGFDGCSMRCFLLLLFASFRFSFVVCVQCRNEKCHRGERKAQTFSPKQNLFSPCCSLTHSAVLARVRSAFPLSPTLSSTFSGSLCLFLWRMLCIILGMQIFQLNTKEIKQNAHSATRRDESVAQEMVGKVSKLLPRCHQSLLSCPHPHSPIH